MKHPKHFLQYLNTKSMRAYYDISSLYNSASSDDKKFIKGFNIDRNRNIKSIKYLDIFNISGYTPPSDMTAKMLIVIEDDTDEIFTCEISKEKLSFNSEKRYTTVNDGRLIFLFDEREDLWKTIMPSVLFCYDIKTELTFYFQNKTIVNTSDILKYGYDYDRFVKIYNDKTSLEPDKK